MKSHSLSHILPVTVLLACSAHAATVINLLPQADTFLSAKSSDRNFGSAGAVAVAGPGSSQGEFQSLMRFDFASMKSQLDGIYAGGWLVNSISLQVTATIPNNAIFSATAAGNLAVRWLSSNIWTEGNGKPSGITTEGVSFNSLSTLLGAGTEPIATFAFNGETADPLVVGFSLSAGLLADIRNGSQASLDIFAVDGTASALFNSRDNATSSYRPQLVVTAIAAPEPSPVILSMAALIVPALRRRR